MERLEFLLAELEQLPYTGQNDCLFALNEHIHDLIYFLEAAEPQAKNALNHLQACRWMIYEGHHFKTEEQFFASFYYMKDKVQRACKPLLDAKRLSKTAA